MADDLSIDLRHEHVASLPDDPDAELSTSEWNHQHVISPGAITVDMMAPGLGMAWRGPWLATTDYVPGDVVFSAGSAYICTIASTGEEPPHASWDSLAERGATWFSAHGAPTFVVGSKLGDWYIDEDTDIVYELE